MTLQDTVILGVSALTGLVLVWPRVARSESWRAIVTPLASIIGSGFLVLGPLLDLEFGAVAPAVMAALCLVAYGFGWSIRVNIAHLDTGPARPAADLMIERVASWTLVAAYVVSVSYYLNLFGSFAVELTPWKSALAANLVTTAAFCLIVAIGCLRGFGALEKVEEYSVALKLAIIAGLLVALAIYVAGQARAGALIAAPARISGLEAVTLAFGLIVTVQGFETSRYLGATYSATRRIRSMRQAQWISVAVYMAYILLTTYVFPPGRLETTETAIIDMMRIVSRILPPLLVAAALAAQFSAAVADTAGSGGLLEELTQGRVTAALGYVALAAAGVAMTWSLHVFEIIAYASRAFAFYYALQSLLAARSEAARGRKGRASAHAALAALGIAIAIFGQSIEGGS